MTRRGGQGRCAACEHDHQDAINENLVRGVSLNSLEKKWGISRAALRAHRKNHISPSLVALRAERIMDGVRPVTQRVQALSDEAQAMYEAAKAGGNFQQALHAIKELRNLLELLARVTGELNERPQVTVNLQTTQEWIKVQTVVLAFMERYPEKDRQELSRRLMALDAQNGHAG